MFEKNQDILLHPKGATTMPTGIKVLVCDDDAAFCKKMPIWCVKVSRLTGAALL